MKTIYDKLEAFQVVGIHPGANYPNEAKYSALETITEKSFPGKWKVLYFYPKAFTAVCPTEIAEFSDLAGQFEGRNAVLIGGSVDDVYTQLAWRRDEPLLAGLNHWQFSDTSHSLTNQMGVFDKVNGTTFRATYIIDPENTIQHVSVNTLAVGRNVNETLRVLDALQTNKFCAAGRQIGASTIVSAPSVISDGVKIKLYPPSLFKDCFAHF